MNSAQIRNVAIVAHVDHGKTTLVDALLKYARVVFSKDVPQELIMDSNDLERERGITIFSKNAAVIYGDVKVNIIDTPGHADFGGEVERVLKMADGVLLLIDAQEGPMPQTRFVVKKALQAGLKPVVIINKVDKPNARPGWALEKTYELFIDLGATDEQIEFSVIYAAAKLGLAGLTPILEEMTDIRPVFEAIVRHIPAPAVDANGPLQLQIASLASDTYKGKIAIGRVQRGELHAGAPVVVLDRKGQRRDGRLISLMTFEGLGRVERTMAPAGDLVAVAGLPDVAIGDTICDPAQPEALSAIPIEQPTVKITVGVNTSPFAGREGTYLTSRHIKERLERELMTDVALKVEAGGSESEFVVSGRGELHLAILIERLRREGYELQVSKPEVIAIVDETGARREPVEDVWLEVPEISCGVVIDKLNRRKATLVNMRVEDGLAHFHFTAPTRALIGYRSQLMTDSHGLGVINTLWRGYEPWHEALTSSPHGSLVAFEAGIATAYGLKNAQERGVLFVGPSEEIYEGEVVGENAKAEDLDVNVCKAKHLTNMRSKGDGVAEGLEAAHRLSLEDALEYIGDDELVEVTPQSIRVRKKILKGSDRYRERRPDR